MGWGGEFWGCLWWSESKLDRLDGYGCVWKLDNPQIAILDGKLMTTAVDLEVFYFLTTLYWYPHESTYVLHSNICLGYVPKNPHMFLILKGMYIYIYTHEYTSTISICICIRIIYIYEYRNLHVWGAIFLEKPIYLCLKMIGWPLAAQLGAGQCQSD